MKTKTKNKPAYTTICYDATVKEKAERLAKKNERSTNYYLRKFIEEGAKHVNK